MFTAVTIALMPRLDKARHAATNVRAQSAYRDGTTQFALGYLEAARKAFILAKELGYSPRASENSPTEWIAFLEPDSATELAVPSFPWPPPKYSTDTELPRSLFSHGDRPMTLREVSELLTAALDGADYPRYSFYTVPGGFALAAQLERINDDASIFVGGRFDFLCNRSRIHVSRLHPRSF